MAKKKGERKIEKHFLIKKKMKEKNEAYSHLCITRASQYIKNISS